MKMAETLGTLIDKLCIANVKLWHLEDVRRDKERDDAERLAAADLVTVVNADRNALIEEIDQYLSDVLDDPVNHRVFKKHPLYKGGV